MAQTAPTLPNGRIVDLGVRGQVFVRESRCDPRAPTVVLLHGWTATADINWHAVYASVSQRANVIAFDHRGHGSGIVAERPFALEDAADDAATVIRTLTDGPVIAVGYSMGGPVAQLLWRRHRNLVDGLVLCATAPVFRGLIWEHVTFTILPALTGAARAAPERMRAKVALGMMAGSDDWPLRAWAHEQMTGHDWVQILHAGRALGRFDSRSWIAEIDVPTAVVATLNDRVVPLERQLHLAATIPGARVHQSVGGHSVVLAEPERFVPPLLDGLDTVMAARVTP